MVGVFVGYKGKDKPTVFTFTDYIQSLFAVLTLSFLFRAEIAHVWSMKPHSMISFYTMSVCAALLIHD